MRPLILSFLFLLSAFMAFAQSKIDPRIDDALLKQLNAVSAHDHLSVLIMFPEYPVQKKFANIPSDYPRKMRQKLVTTVLKRHADSVQFNTLNFLNQILSHRTNLLENQSGRLVENYRKLWIINAIAVSLERAELETLLETDHHIQKVLWDPSFSRESLLDIFPMNGRGQSSSFTVPDAVHDPGVLLIKAPQCWEMGNSGEGVLVGNVDDGFWWKHPDLVKGVYQNLGEDANGNGYTIAIRDNIYSYPDPGDFNGIDDDGNGYVDDLMGWDMDQNSGQILTEMHGTGTLGHVVGDGTMGVKTGVAPGSKCLLVVSCWSQSTHIEAYQYALEMGVDVITSSISFKWDSSPKPDYSLFRQATDVSLAAGVIHTNSISNDGLAVLYKPVPLNIATPGNCPSPWEHPDQLLAGGRGGVIAVGNVDAYTDSVHKTSPYGPSFWGDFALYGNYPYAVNPDYFDYPYSRVDPVEVPDSIGLLKPDIAAPGEGCISTFVASGDGYSDFWGTSAATPHAAGTIALMLSINPELLPADVDQILQLTAIDKGAPGKDPRYGAGRIDAFKATTSPRFLLQGVNGGSNWLINDKLLASDTALELTGISVHTELLPFIGSLKSMACKLETNATSNHIVSFGLWWDRDNNRVVSPGDRKLASALFRPDSVCFDSLKFKFRDEPRSLLLTAETTPLASPEHFVNLSLADTSQVTAYYTTHPLPDHFPFGPQVGIANVATSVQAASLHQNNPNPVSASSAIDYRIAQKGFFTLSLWAVTGELLMVMASGEHQPGDYRYVFNRNEPGRLLNGVYIYKLEGEGVCICRRMVLTD